MLMAGRNLELKEFMAFVPSIYLAPVLGYPKGYLDQKELLERESSCCSDLMGLVTDGLLRYILY